MPLIFYFFISQYVISYEMEISIPMNSMEFPSTSFEVSATLTWEIALCIGVGLYIQT